jgi:hypothetical protein
MAKKTPAPQKSAQAKAKPAATKAATKKPIAKPNLKSAANRASTAKKTAQREATTKVETSRRADAEMKDTSRSVKSITNSPKRVSKSDAIRERVRLYPRAMANEIAAMLEMDGIKVTAEAVQRVQEE